MQLDEAIAGVTFATRMKARAEQPLVPAAAPAPFGEDLHDLGRFEVYSVRPFKHIPGSHREGPVLAPQVQKHVCNTHRIYSLSTIWSS